VNCGHPQQLREYDHATLREPRPGCDPAHTLEQGQADRSEAAAPGKTRLGRSAPTCWSEGRTRDLAMFNLAIDGKRRGCDIVALRVEDIAPNGYAIERATVRQKKTGQPVKFEFTEQTRQAIDDCVKAGRKPGEFCSQAVLIVTDAFQRGSTLGLCPNGWRASGWTQSASVRTHYGEPKRP
jgi:hypothetical protein